MCKKIGFFILSFLVVQTAAATVDELKWVGCGISKKAYVTELSKAFEAKTGVRMVLEGGGATKGIRQVKAGKAHVGGSCRHLLPVDEEAGAKLTPIGWDALVAITHRSNPVKNISTDNLKKVFAGRISNWNEIGGEDQPIKVVVRQGRISGVGRMVRELLFKDPDKDFALGAVALKSSGPVEKTVEKDVNAIAITGISSAKKRNVNTVAIDGFEPSYDNIAKGDFPLFRPLYLVTGKASPAVAKDFVRFALSPEGQEIIRQEGTVNLEDGAKLWPKYRKYMRDARQEGNF